MVKKRAGAKAKPLADKRDNRRVFVIYGRNQDAYEAMVRFLKSLGLDPWTFDQLSVEMGGTPFIGDIVRKGMERAQATVALFTPDEFAVLRPTLNRAGTAGPDARRAQARPNVIYEAGMAMGLASDRTVIVTLGADVQLFSDVHGIHIVQLDNTPKQRHLLRDKLVKMGCEIDMAADCVAVERAGDFESCLRFPNEPKLPENPLAAFEPFGEWDCLWRAGKAWSTADRVLLRRRGDELTGEGVNAKYGKYYLSGRISESNVVTLQYHGDMERYNARGVVILSLNRTLTEMEGWWTEFAYHGKDEFSNGRTEWKKTAGGPDNRNA